MLGTVLKTSSFLLALTLLQQQTQLVISFPHKTAKRKLLHPENFYPAKDPDFYEARPPETPSINTKQTPP